MIKLVAIQLSSKVNVEANLAAIERQLLKIRSTHSEDEQYLVVLPECCLSFGGSDSGQLSLAKQNKEANTLRTSLSELAKRYSVFLVAGTIPILADNGDKFTNSSCVFTPEGELLGRYDKIHLFDVAVSDNTRQYQESSYTQAGNKLSVVDTGFAKVGLSICFDLRFPVLFQSLCKKGASVITVPSAFTKVTGKAHWQTLLQARAIENQVYIIAAGQEGIHENGRETWGHSMIISPWGEIMANLSNGEGFISATYQPEEVKRIRESMPLVSPLL